MAQALETPMLTKQVRVHVFLLTKKTIQIPLLEEDLAVTHQIHHNTTTNQEHLPPIDLLLGIQKKHQQNQILQYVVPQLLNAAPLVQVIKNQAAAALQDQATPHLEAAVALLQNLLEVPLTTLHQEGVHQALATLPLEEVLQAVVQLAAVQDHQVRVLQNQAALEVAALLQEDVNILIHI
jgi:hypothetical protein